MAEICLRIFAGKATARAPRQPDSQTARRFTESPPVANQHGAQRSDKWLACRQKAGSPPSREFTLSVYPYSGMNHEIVGLQLTTVLPLERRGCRVRTGYPTRSWQHETLAGIHSVQVPAWHHSGASLRARTRLSTITPFLQALEDGECLYCRRVSFGRHAQADCPMTSVPCC